MILMKKAIKIILPSVIIIGIILYSLFINGLLVTDYSAILGESNRLIWQGRTYWSASYKGYEVGRIIAKGEPNLVLHQIKNDPNHNYLFSSGFRDSVLYMAEDYEPETNIGGEVRLAVWGNSEIKDADFLKAIAEIERQKTSTFKYETDIIDEKVAGEQYMDKLYLAYEKSPMADVYVGYLGRINGKWAITTHIPNHTYYEDGEINTKRHTVECYIIPEKYHAMLDMFGKEYF